MNFRILNRITLYVNGTPPHSTTKQPVHDATRMHPRRGRARGVRQPTIVHRPGTQEALRPPRDGRGERATIGADDLGSRDRSSLFIDDPAADHLEIASRDLRGASLPLSPARRCARRLRTASSRRPPLYFLAMLGRSGPRREAVSALVSDESERNLDLPGWMPAAVLITYAPSE